MQDAGDELAEWWDTKVMPHIESAGNSISSEWTSFVNDPGQSIIDNRGMLATAGATIGCFIPAVGWGPCAVFQGVAHGVRPEQSIRENGWEKAKDGVIADGVVTAATAGLVRMPMAEGMYGALGFSHFREARWLVGPSTRDVMKPSKWMSPSDGGVFRQVPLWQQSLVMLAAEGVLGSSVQSLCSQNSGRAGCRSPIKESPSGFLTNQVPTG